MDLIAAKDVGIVAAEDVVAYAIACAGMMCLKNRNGFDFVNKANNPM